jgi:ribosomal protein L24E
MRTYDDTFSGQRIYPGKVRIAHSCDSDQRRISYPESSIAPTRKRVVEVVGTSGGKFVDGNLGGLLFGQNAHDSDDVLSLQGKLYVRGDSKIFRFQNGKSESLFLQRKNPRRIAWTVLYRRQHRKGISEVRFFRIYTTSELGMGTIWGERGYPA